MSALTSNTATGIGNLKELALEVLKQYDIQPDDVTVIQSGSLKTVWKARRQNRLYCLKRLRHTYDKALFSVNAQIHIRKSGGNVPEIYPARDGKRIVQHNDQLFVLYEWLEGKELNFNLGPDFSSALKGLAKFHMDSKGYTPPPEARISTKENKWPEQYASMKNRMLEWKKTAAANQSTTCHAAYLKHVDTVIGIADSAMDLLDKSQYSRLTQPQSGKLVLCHQDFGTGNAMASSQGVYIIDLDGVTFDLPARDLRKIIGKRAELKGQWTENLIQYVCSEYESVHSLDREDKRVLYIDLLFPHWFFGLIKNQYQSSKPVKPSEIERIARLESSKVELLKSLIQKGWSA